MNRKKVKQEIENLTVVYSGGYDSLLAVLKTAERVKCIHLVTFKTYGIFATGLASRNLENLRRNFPIVRFVPRTFDVTSLHRKILSGFLQDCVKYEKQLPPFQLWCGTCQLTMRTAALLYCIKNRIKYCVDGARRDQVYYQIHTAEVVNCLRRLFARYGVKLLNPVYDYRGEPEELLEQKGYDTGWTSIKKSITFTQPICLQSLSGIGCRMYQVCNSVSNIAKGEFIKSRIPLVTELIDSYIEKAKLKPLPGAPVELKDEELLPETGDYYRPVPTEKQIRICRMLKPFYQFLGWAIRIIV